MTTLVDYVNVKPLEVYTVKGYVTHYDATAVYSNGMTQHVTISALTLKSHKLAKQLAELGAPDELIEELKDTLDLAYSSGADDAVDSY